MVGVGEVYGRGRGLGAAVGVIWLILACLPGAFIEVFRAEVTRCNLQAVIGFGMWLVGWLVVIGANGDGDGD